VPQVFIIFVVVGVNGRVVARVVVRRRHRLRPHREALCGESSRPRHRARSSREPFSVLLAGNKGITQETDGEPALDLHALRWA
jgi:hypothetical protein